MPWFPDFVGAAELARRDTQAAGRADPVGQYLRALEEGNARLLEKVWPGQVVVNDPLVGAVQGHGELRHFVNRNRAWLAEHQAHTETVAATRVGRRAVVELMATLEEDGIRRLMAHRRGGRLRRRPFGDLPHLLQHVALRRASPPAASHPRGERSLPR